MRNQNPMTSHCCISHFDVKRPLAILVIAVYSVSCAAQAPTKYEVASIRRDPSGSTNTHINVTRGRLTITNASLKTLIRNAYDLQSFQFAGGPSWLDGDMYDISATTGSSDDITNDQFRVLLRNLLADRFQLKVHWETRQTNVYALVVAKNGPSLKEDSDPEKESGINTSKFSHEGRMTGTKEPVSILAGNLGNQLGRIVIDKTGLQGKYDWTLVWDPDPTPESTNPSIVTAVQEQLGLKLESQKGPMETLVIDSAQQPSEN
jgi:uncharacterized protein (TIGR03435 family)